ncbi:hypothetical protein N9499_06130 [Octadecabacter sp.]|nr:hypothetical protein [Octadecabacter sp.]
MNPNLYVAIQFCLTNISEVSEQSHDRAVQDNSEGISINDQYGLGAVYQGRSDIRFKAWLANFTIHYEKFGGHIRLKTTPECLSPPVYSPYGFVG